MKRVVVTDRNSDLAALRWRGGHWVAPQWECSRGCSASCRSLEFWVRQKWTCPQCGTQHSPLRVIAVDVDDVDGDAAKEGTGNRDGKFVTLDRTTHRIVDER